MSKTGATARLVTAEELVAMGDIGRCELIKGEIVKMAPAGAEHGGIAGELLGRIWMFVQQRNLGKVYAAETGFIIARNPDTTRAPDVAFVRRERVPPGRVRRYFPGPPDLAVEVVSPADRVTDVLTKVDEWLAAGTVSVWVIDPKRRAINVYRQPGLVLRYRASDVLTDEPTLPGFVLKLQDLFEPDEAPS